MRQKTGFRWRGIIQTQQALPEGVPGGFGAVGDADLFIDVGHVAPSGAVSDDQFFRDLAVASSLGQEAQDLDLPLGQAVGVGGGGLQLRPHCGLAIGHQFHQRTQTQLRCNCQ